MIFSNLSFEKRGQHTFSNTTKFRNLTLCGECDFQEYSELTDESKLEFKNLCYYRYDLKDIKECEDLFNPEKNNQ